MEFNLIMIFVLICYLILLLTGVFLLYRMLKTRLYNLTGLVMFFIIFPLQYFIQQLSYLFYAVIAEVALIFLVLFVKDTFYKQKKSIFPIVLISLLILKIIDFIIRIQFQFTVPESDSLLISEILFYYVLAIVVSVQIIISLSWLSYASLNVYNRLKKQNIEPWIKKRYIIIGFSSIFFGLNGFILPFIPIGTGFENLFFTTFVAITIFIFTFGNLIAWVMPNKLKKFFSRNYKPIEEEVLSERELMEKIKLQVARGDRNGDN
ncbi:MAG: hypothetical protein ACFE8J_07210 [Candidatus Heimdallarchaeota archaeon]